METKEKQDLSEKRLRELTGQKELLQQRLSNIDNLINRNSRVSIQKFNQAVKRLAKKLAQENRLKNRRLGAGPKPLLDFLMMKSLLHVQLKAKALLMEEDMTQFYIRVIM